MANTTETTAPSPRQPLNGQGVLRISGAMNSKSRNTSRIAILNISTMRGKEEEVVDIMRSRRLAIVGLSETRMKDSGERILHENYKLIYSGKEDGRHGVGVVLAPELAPYVEKVDCISERIISLSIKTKTVAFSLIQVYAPQRGRPSQEKDQFYRDLQDATDTARYKEKLIVCGDFNGHIGSERDHVETVVGAFGLGDRNEEGGRVIDYGQLNRLAIMNTFYKHRESHKWTYYGWNSEAQQYVSKSMIDLFLTSDKKMFRNVRAVPSLSMDSTHRMVVATLTWKTEKLPKKKGKRRFNLEKLRDPETANTMRQVINNKILEAGNRGWKTYKDVVSSAAADAIGFKKTYQGRKKTTPWWTEAVKSAVGEKMRLFRKWMKRRRPEDRLEYEVARNRAEKVKQEEKDRVWEKIGEDLRNDHSGTKKLLYSMTKNYRSTAKEQTGAIKDQNGQLLVQPDDIANRWKEYFDGLLNVRGSQESDANVDLASSPDEVSEDITEAEISAAIARMKRGRATGDDELPVEIVKEAGDEAQKLLLNIMQDAYRHETVPPEWQRGVINPIFKKGDKALCGNYRGITLLSHCGKLFSSIIENRVRTLVEGSLGEWQYGFRPGRSTSDLVFVMKMIMEKSWEWGRDKFALFIDMEKAFDCVPRNLLWKIMAEPPYYIPKKLIRVIKSMYTGSVSKVRKGDVETDWFNIETGVRQGDGLSPLLFVIFMDKCIRDTNPQPSHQVLAYADDVAVMVDSIQELQDVASTWVSTMRSNGMSINTAKGKTEFMHISRRREEFEVYMEDRKLHQANSYKYLGVVVDDSNIQETELNARIEKYTRNFMMLYPLMKEKCIPTQVKTTIYNTILKPILTYGAECWSLTTKTSSRLQAAEMKVLRTIRGVTRRDRLKNERIRADLSVKPLLREIEENKLRWYGHVKRMDEERLAKRYLEWKPQGKRPVGRPRKRWIDGVGEALERRGTCLRDVEERRTYEDRDNWRDVVKCSPADR